MSELEYVHLWMATQGTKGSEELQVKIASSATISQWALARWIKLRGLAPA